MNGLNWKHILLVLGALAIVVGALQAAGVATTDAVTSFVEGSLAGPAAWRETLREMTPLVVTGLAVFIALRAGLFNIGADGQLVMGALAAAAIALNMPGLPGVVLGCVGAVFAGALWAWPAAWIKAYRGGHEVISTIMLNNIAVFLTGWIVTGPLRDPNQQSPTTGLLPGSTAIPMLVNQPPFRVNLALVLGLIGVVVFAVWLKRTVYGYELSLVGSNPTAARTAGVNVRAVTMKAMMASGGVAGLAGAFLVLAFERRFYANFSPGYGFDALGVALLSGGTPWGLVPAALLFSVLSSGTSALQLTGVPKGMSGILLGLLIIVFASVRYRRTRIGES